MDAEQVVEKILSQSRKQAEEITSEAQQKCDGDRNKLQSQLDAFNAETKTLAEAANKDQLSRMLAAARMDNRKQLLGAKVRLLAEVFDGAIDQIKSMGDEEYKQLMSQLMVKAVETGTEHVIVGRDETRIDDKLIKSVNRELGPGYRGNLQLDPERTDIKAGFILRHGDVSINVSAEVLVKQMHEQMEMELAAELFGQ